MRPARILFLTDAFLPHRGGARVYYYHLLRELSESRRAEITILTKKVPNWAEFDVQESRPGFRLIRSGRPLPNWKVKEWPKIVVPLLRALPLLATGRHDLIHFGDLYPAGVLSLWFKRTLGIPYVAYCHGEEITQTDRRRYQPKVRNAVLRNAEIVVAANEFARENLLRIGIPAERIRKITPGVDCMRFQPRERRPDLVSRYGLDGKTVLLTVARLVPRKGHATVLAALREFVRTNPQIIYLIAGTGPEEQRLRQLVQEWDLESHVRFAGFVRDEELADYYNLCDIFVMPNSEDRGDVEGFGMVFIEANACGKPVVGGKSGGAAEAVLDGETGLLVTPDSPAETADVLRSLVHNRQLRSRLGSQGLARARSDFNWQVQARALDAVNREILQRLHPSDCWRLPCSSDPECRLQQPLS
jgi:phosphatidylinositol alpha-1,6-mannosyltransferase